MKFVAISLAGLVVLATCQRHNFSWGHRGPYDVLLNRTTVQESPRSSSRSFRTRNVLLRYPEKDQLSQNIAAINVVDGFSDGRGGYAKIWSGGVGQNYTSIWLRSQRGLGMNFTVEIYGH